MAYKFKYKLSLISFILCITKISLASDLIYAEFKDKFNTDDISTEKGLLATSRLSQSYAEDPINGLTILQKTDQAVIDGLKIYQRENLESTYNIFKKAYDNNGKIYIIGSGSSGRIAVDLGYKWNNYCLSQSTQHDNKLNADFVEGIIAGGLSAFVRAREGFEDSYKDGEEVFKNKNITPNDVAVLISASGTATFNNGVGNAARKKGATVISFRNSQKIPERTQELLSDNQIVPIVVDTGGQPIQGSTRLHAATIDLAVMGYTLNLVALSPTVLSPKDIQKRFTLFLNQTQNVNALILDQIPHIQHIAEIEHDIFAHKDANFYKLRDESSQGYVTMVANKGSFRETKIDATETAPTFSTNPPRPIHELGYKKAEYRAYLIGNHDNLEAWETICGHSLCNDDVKDANAILIAQHAGGEGSYIDRPKGLGNLLLGVLKTDATNEDINEISKEFKEARANEGKCVFIGVTTNDIAESIKFHKLKGDCNVSIIYNLNSHEDPLGITETVLIKQTLNLISNGAMLGMKKVLGNVMVDLVPSNNKLISRLMSIIKKDNPKINEEKLYCDILAMRKYKKETEVKYKISLKPAVKIIQDMIDKNHTAQQVIDSLMQTL